MFRIPILIACGCLAAAGCSDASSVRGSLYITRWNVREPAVSVPVYALPVHNEIDRKLAALCADDSLLNAIGELEYPIGPVRVQGDGIELDASLPAAAPNDRRQPDTVSDLTWIRRRGVYATAARYGSGVRASLVQVCMTLEIPSVGCITSIVANHEPREFRPPPSLVEARVERPLMPDLA